MDMALVARFKTRLEGPTDIKVYTNLNSLVCEFLYKSLTAKS